MDESNLVHEHAIKSSTAKVFIFSVRWCALEAETADYPLSVKSWTDTIERFTDSISCRELDRIDGEPVVFEWNIFPRHTTLKLLREVQNMMKKELKVLPKDFKDRIIFMSMHNDIDWNQKRQMKRLVNVIPQVLRNMSRIFPKGHWSFLGPGSKEKWYVTLTYKPDVLWDKFAEEMLLFLESGHLVFRGTSPLSRRPLESTVDGKNIDTLQSGTCNCRVVTTHH